MSSVLDLLSVPQRQLVCNAREIAQQLQLSVYLVGGPLRDLLLGKMPVDIDFTLERDSEPFARELARQSGGQVQAYPQFMTFKVVVPGQHPIDVATTRRETYPHPGALPVVTASGLRDDLFRRDFTINALALELVSETVHDFFGGESDLGQHWIRVLHEKSFIDDPTRIYRAIRLATRLGFTVEPGTLELMHSAIESAAAKTVSRQRLWREFFLALEEPLRAQILFAFTRENALEVLVGKTEATDEFLHKLTRLDELLLRDSADRRVAFLALLLWGQKPEDSVFSGSGMTLKQIQRIRGILEDLPELLKRLQNAGSESDRLRVSGNASAELLVLAAVEEPTLEPLLDRLRDYRKLDAGVRGDELGVPPGPHIGLALERTREALFLGEITRQEAAAFARKIALEYLEKKNR